MPELEFTGNDIKPLMAVLTSHYLDCGHAIEYQEYQEYQSIIFVQ